MSIPPLPNHTFGYTSGTIAVGSKVLCLGDVNLDISQNQLDVGIVVNVTLKDTVVVAVPLWNENTGQTLIVEREVGAATLAELNALYTDHLQGNLP